MNKTCFNKYDEIIKLIPEFLEVKDVAGDYVGHVEYIGYGYGKNFDYWDCYCLRDGCRPPSTLQEFIIQVQNPEKVMEWWRKYNFNCILCQCDCCHGAIPRIIFGFVDKEEDFDQITDETRADSMEHSFFVLNDGKLLFRN